MKKLNKHWLSLVIGIFVLVLAACMPASPTTSPQPTSAPGTPTAETPTGGQLPAEAVLAAQAWLAQQLGVEIESIEILSSQQVEWADACLGLGRADEGCAAVITPGWEVVLNVNGQQYTLRTDETGTQVRQAEPAPTPEAGAPSEAVLAAQAWLAQQLGVDLAAVEIVSNAPAEWTDSCLGLGQANESCAAVITPGWEVVLRVNGQEYTLRTDATGEVVRQAEPAPGANNPLENTSWSLVSMGEPGAETPVVTGTTVTLDLGPGGQASGSGGCNSYSGTYQADGGTISFGDVITTEMACTNPGVMEQEQAFYEALQSAGEYELSGDQLTIRYNDGAAALNFAAAGSEPGTGSELENSMWILRSYGDPDAQTPTLESTEVTLNFDTSGRAGGSSGCNSYGGPYTVDGSNIQFSEIVSTLMLCADEGVMEQEQAFLMALQSASSFEMTEDQLTITYTGEEGNQVLIFARSPEDPSAGSGSLANTQWTLDTFGGADAVSSVIAGSEITLEFDAEGQAGGNGGCNSYGSPYQVDGGSISFGPVVSTKMACADEAVTRQESQYFQALESAARFELAGDSLTLFDANGTAVLIFTRG